MTDHTPHPVSLHIEPEMLRILRANMPDLRAKMTRIERLVERLGIGQLVEIRELADLFESLESSIDRSVVAVKQDMMIDYEPTHVFDMCRIEHSRDAMLEWLEEHHLGDGYEVQGDFVGITNPHAAFHFKMVWIG